MIRPAQVPSTGVPALHQLAQRLGEPLALEAERHRGGLAAGDHERVEPLELGGRAHARGVGAERLEHARVRLEVALDGEHPEPGHGLPAAVLEQAAVAERRDLDARHGRAEVARGGGDALGVLEVRGGLDDGRAVRSGFST